MRIALACPYAWDAPGGVQTQVRGLAKRFRDRGHDVLVLASSSRDWQEPGLAIVGRPVRVPFNGSVAPICPDPRSRPRIREALRGFAPDVVHVHEPFAPSTSLYAALDSPAPVVATFHSYMERSVLLSAAAPFLDRLWSRFAVRIAVSRAAAEWVHKSFEGSMRVIPNGVDVERFRFGPRADLPEGRRMLFVSRLDRRKGFRVALHVLDRTLQSVPDAMLVVVGEGPERRVLAEAPPRVRARVLMVGTVSNAELPPYHRACEIFLAPAIGRESFGVILVEAMSAGLPVVGSDIAGYREVVRDGVEGLLSAPGNSQGLAAAAVTLFSDSAIHERMRRAASERADRFGWERVADEVEVVNRDAVRVGEA